MVEAMTDIKPDVVVTDLPDPAPSSPLEALEWLGSTVEEVVEGLRARGIKCPTAGKASETCGLATYLQQWWPNAWVADHYVWTSGRDADPIAGEHLIAFQRAFDAGEFPDLVAD